MLSNGEVEGRPKVPDGAEGARFLSARGAKPQAHHGPLQRLLDCTSASRDLARRRAMSVPRNATAKISNPTKRVPRSVFDKVPV
jgi:hypothetical protein